MSKQQEERPVKVVIAGAGIAGNVFLRQLLARSDGDGNAYDIVSYEARSFEDASPPGLNVLMSHNGLAVLREADPSLYKDLQELGLPTVNWSARTMDGRVLYHLEDVVASGEAAVPAVVARWSEIHAATRVDERTVYRTKVVRVEEQEDSKRLSVLLLRDEETEEWIRDVDYLVAADGRYSALRAQLSPTPTEFGPPYVADFRIVVSGIDTASISDHAPTWRLYHQPSTPKDASSAMRAATTGCVRVGLMKLGPDTLGLFGNIPMESTSVLSPELKSAEILASLFAHEAPDAMGQAVLDILRNHGDKAHFARKQQTSTCYTALDGRVLFIGDSAGAIYPSLGQGANLSLEDASVAAACFPDIATISKLRLSRRRFIQDMSRYHAEHISDPNFYDHEMNNWNDTAGPWRASLRQLWCHGKQLVLRAVTATTENFRPFGQLITESLDGDVFDPTGNDADLDVSQGVPRLYYMKLTGGRPLLVDRITRHQKVTQCLGALGDDADFYLVVHAPDVTPLSFAGLHAFRIPPQHFVKLSVGTWHAGPMWTGRHVDRTFVNLELADTNIHDHDTVMLQSLLPHGATTQWNAHVTPEATKEDELVIPIAPC